MLGKINIGIAVVVLILIALWLTGNEFSPYPNFIFAVMTLMFLLQGIEDLREKKKWEGSLRIFLAFITFSVVVTSV